MADWKQITARIRRARTGKDPVAQLTNLFTKTRDAMVAFELARYLESTGNTGDAGRWFLTAAERFRRSDWKTKAQENATRLGATSPAEIPASSAKSESAEDPEAKATEAATAAETEEESSDKPARESRESPHEPAEERPTPHAARSSNSDENRNRRSNRREDHRSGRRGEHREQPGSHRSSRSDSRDRRERQAAQVPQQENPAPSRSSRPVSDDSAVTTAPGLRGRFGDPGLSSRLSQLEMSFRRLLSSAPTKLDDADKAPAGPGVWLLTDSDLSTYYYVEACQTLRVAIPNLLRGGSARRAGSNDSIRPMLAEHLGIPENRVSKYLSDHCVVRWLQMDEGASHFAHFLIAVLRPSLNE